MKKLKQGTLFAGVGGFELGGAWAGIENVWSNEIDADCCIRLRNNFNHEIIENDVRNIGKHNLKPVDIISGGDPCQPHSLSGVRQGVSDERYLWPEYYRIVRELRPRYVVNENVFGTISNGVLDQKINDLEAIGYTCWPPIIIPANFMGAWHTRRRVWLLAYAPVQGRGSLLRGNKSPSIKTGTPPITLDSQGNPFLQFAESMGKPAVFGMVDGLSGRVDFLKRLGMMGNSIVPQIYFYLLKSILIHDTII